MTKTSRAAEVPEPTNRPTVLSDSNSETQNVQLAQVEGSFTAALDAEKQPTVNVRHHIRRRRRRRRERPRKG